MKAFITLLVLAAASVGGYYGYQRWRPTEMTTSYQTAPVRQGEVVATFVATGTLEPLVKVLVGSRVSGNVTKWYKDFNAPVRAGDLLAEIDQDRYQAAIVQRKADLAVSQARVEEAAARVAEAELQLRQLQAAYERNASSSFEVESARIAVEAAKAALHAAEATVGSAQAQLEAAEIDLTYTKILTPIDGVVISRDVDEGQTVAASLQAPTLFTIAQDLRKMRVNAAVSEMDIGLVREGMAAVFRVDAYPERRFRGVVTQVRYAETVLNNVVSYQTLIEVDNPDLLLRPGMTATIEFESARADNVVLVPNAALRFDPELTAGHTENWRPGKGQKRQPRVYRLVGGALKEFPVTLGITDGSYTQIESPDLNVGDEVVTERVFTAADLAAGPGNTGMPGMPGSGQRRGPRF